jgi:hypothetical protein
VNNWVCIEIDILKQEEEEEEETVSTISSPTPIKQYFFFQQILSIFGPKIWEMFGFLKKISCVEFY